MTGFSWLRFLFGAGFLEQAANWITPVALWSIANPFLSLSFSPALRYWRVGVGPGLQAVALWLGHKFLAFA